MIDFRYGKPLSSDAVIPDFERKFGISLPESYIKIVNSYDGSSVENANCVYTNPYDGTKETISWGGLIPFEGEEDYFTMEQANSDLAEGIPSGIVLFGKEGGGYLYAFDYRNAVIKNQPSVVVINLENPPEHIVTEIAPNFDHFIEALIPDPDEPIP